jgi:hypothetical protein
MEINRRRLITGLVGIVAAPALVHAQNIMPVKAFDDNPIVFMTVYKKIDKETGKVTYEAQAKRANGCWEPMPLKPILKSVCGW